jgi:hypothetical protein
MWPGRVLSGSARTFARRQAEHVCQRRSQRLDIPGVVSAIENLLCTCVWGISAAAAISPVANTRPNCCDSTTALAQRQAISSAFAYSWAIHCGELAALWRAAVAK